MKQFCFSFLLNIRLLLNMFSPLYYIVCISNSEIQEPVSWKSESPNLILAENKTPSLSKHPLTN